MKLTRRGWIVFLILGSLFAAGFAYVTRDLCWVGDGYGSCAELMSHYGN